MAFKKKVSAPRFKKPRKKTGFFNTFVYDFGCKFRSKFEWRVARWLEKFEIKWQFEPKVAIAGSRCYPDFYLPEYDTFLELRPEKRVDEKLLRKVYHLKNTYRKECVIATDITGAKTFLTRLDESRKPSQPEKVWIFTGKRGELKENPYYAKPTIEPNSD